MEFEWNIAKAKSNLKKHNISFKEATTVFGDSLSITHEDINHSYDEYRYIIIGQSDNEKILVVSHMYHNETIRIISARHATKKERNYYEN